MNFSESVFLKRLFDSLAQNQIRYAVLRNAGTLPDSTDGSDLDILVAKGSMGFAADLVCRACSACGGDVVVFRRTGCFTQLMMIGKGAQGRWGACVDLFDDILYRNTLPVVLDDILRYRVKTGSGVWTFDDETAHLVGFAKEWLINGRHSTRYEALARSAADHGKAEQILAPEIANDIKAALRGKKTSPTRQRRRGWLRPLRYLGYQVGKVTRIANPSGHMLCILGTDGSGKSTVIDAIKPILNSAFHNQLVVHHLKPDLLPPLGRLRGVKYEPGHVCTDPHGSKPSGFFGSMLRITYLTIDYISGYWLKVRPKLAKIPTGNWIFDRYAYDMILDQRRFRLHLPKWIVQAYVTIIPKPELILCLGGDPHKIYARKPETSLQEVARQVKELKDFCNRHANAVWIDTTKAPNETVEDVLNAIQSRLCVKGLK